METFLLCYNPLRDAKKRRANDIWAELGGLGLGRPENIYRPLLSDIPSLGGGGFRNRNLRLRNAPHLPLSGILFNVVESALFAKKYRRL